MKKPKINAIISEAISKASVEDFTEGAFRAMVLWLYNWNKQEAMQKELAANSLDDNPNIGVYRNFGVDIITSPIEKSNPVGGAVTNYLIKSYLDYNSK